MSRTSLRVLLLLSAASLAGYFALRADSPNAAGRHFTSRVARPMRLPDDHSGSGKSLYLRRELSLTKRPDHAWLRVLGHDTIAVFVNGVAVDRSRGGAISSDNAVLLDLAPLLRQGKNCIAVSVYQTTLASPPLAAVDGELHFRNAPALTLNDGWVCSDHFERRGEYWYDLNFDASHWAEPAYAPERKLCGGVAIPPRAITTPLSGQWVSPPGVAVGQGAVRRLFSVEGAPRRAWLRFLAAAPASVAVNGIVVRSDATTLGKSPTELRRLILVDVSPHIKQGENVVAAMLASTNSKPAVVCELEVEDQAGRFTRVASGPAWQGAGGTVADWHEPPTRPEGDAENPAWRPCDAEVVSLAAADRWVQRRLVADESRLADGVTRFAGWSVYAVAAFVLLGVLVTAVNWFTNQLNPGGPTPDAAIALTPPIVAALLGLLASYDVTLDLESIYSYRWLGWVAWYLAIAWLGLVVVATRTDRLGPTAAPRRADAGRSILPSLGWPEWLAVAGIVAVAIAGLHLRTTNLLAEPFHHDEVGAYFFTISAYQNGAPGGQVHPDMPFGYAATSELVYYLNMPFAWFFDEPLLVIRAPAVMWSMLTLLLVSYCGWRLFGPRSAVIAACLYAFSPYLIGMSNFGRYFSQLQFFALLACYAFFRAIEGRGPLRPGAVWLTVAAFIAAFLSWEACAFLGIGMFVAGLLYRRRAMRPVITCPHAYAGAALIVLVFLAQNAHRIEQQTQRLWYGSGISNMSAAAMWQYPLFDAMFYIRRSSWTADTLYAEVGLFLAACMALTHPRRGPVRLLLVSLAVTSMLMVAVLPLRSTRYVYHLAPLAILLSAAAVDAVASAVARSASSGKTPRGPSYAGLQTSLAVGLIVVVATGATLQTPELRPHSMASVFRPKQLKFAHWEEPLRFVRKNMREGDVVMSLFPHLTDLTMTLADSASKPGGRAGSGVLGDQRYRSDYWLQSIMMLQATLSDAEPITRDRRAGTAMVPDRETLEEVFEKNDRVWYLTIRQAHSRLNNNSVSELVRQNMDIVFEDARTVVFLRDRKNRTAEDRYALDAEAEEAGVDILN